MTPAELAAAAARAFALVSAEADVEACEVFVAANTHLVARLCYTSHIPSHGVEEPKSTEAAGLGIQVVLRGAEGPRVGFGAEPSDLGPEGVRRALAKARAAAIRDPAFVSLPRPGPEPRRLRDYHDPRLARLSDEALVAAGWRVVSAAVEAFREAPRLRTPAQAEAALAALGLALGGDVSVLHERVAVVSTHLPEVQTDETTLVTTAATAMVERLRAKGSGWTTGTRLEDLTGEAGAEAARAAVHAVGGERVPSGRYTVILGPQPLADLLNNLVLPALHASAFYAANTPFLGRWGRPVASPRLSLHDHGALPGFAGSKGITCEGLPTGRTDLIRGGVLQGLLANWYESQRLLRDPEARTKLGVDPAEAAPGLVPRNGFRFVPGGGRHFAAPPGIAATNVFVEGTDPAPLAELVRQVGEGLYVGRIWYTYPINGRRAGDFTCTVVADSFVIREGRLAAPLLPNRVRINDNIATVLQNVVGVSREVRGTTVWAADEVVYAPALAVSGLEVEAIGGAAGDP